MLAYLYLLVTGTRSQPTVLAGTHDIHFRVFVHSKNQQQGKNLSEDELIFEEPPTELTEGNRSRKIEEDHQEPLEEGERDPKKQAGPIKETTG
jgi:hypothetical protein